MPVYPPALLARADERHLLQLLHMLTPVDRPSVAAL